MASKTDKTQFSAEGITFLLLFLVALLRPHISGIAYPFSQGLFLVPIFVGLGIFLLAAKPPPVVPKRCLLSLTASWLLALWTFLTLFWTADPGQGVRESVAILLCVSVFTLTFLQVSSEKVLRTRWLVLTGLTAGLVAVRALYQRYFGFEKLLETLVQMESTGENVTSYKSIIAQKRVFAGFLNSNMLAGFIAVVIPFFLDLALTASSRRQRQVFGSMVAILTGVLVLTASFGGILLAGIMAGVVMVIRKGVKGPTVAVGVVIVLLLVSSIVAIRGSEFLFGPESSFTQRAGYMAAGIRMAIRHPLLGWGAGSTPGTLMTFVGEGIRPVADPHNFLLRIWIALGIPGIGLFSLALLSWFRAVFGAFRNSGWRNFQPGSIGLLSGSFAFILHSLVDMDFFVPETAFFGWLVMGAAMGTAPIQSGNAEGTVERRFSWAGLVASGLLLGAVIPGLVFFQGEITAFKGERMMNKGRAGEAADLYHEAGRLLPYNGRFALGEGRALKAAGKTASARELFQKADRLMTASPYPPWELGLIALHTGNTGESIVQMERALKRYPTSPRIRIDLARAWLRSGDHGKAADLLRQSRRYAMFDRDARQAIDIILKNIEP